MAVITLLPGALGILSVENPDVFLSPAGRRGTLTLKILGTTASIESSPPEYDSINR